MQQMQQQQHLMPTCNTHTHVTTSPSTVLAALACRSLLIVFCSVLHIYYPSMGMIYCLAACDSRSCVFYWLNLKKKICYIDAISQSK